VREVRREEDQREVDVEGSAEAGTEVEAAVEAVVEVVDSQEVDLVRVVASALVERVLTGLAVVVSQEAVGVGLQEAVEAIRRKGRCARLMWISSSFFKEFGTCFLYIYASVRSLKIVWGS
jgi:hypothetical protein